MQVVSLGTTQGVAVFEGKKETGLTGSTVYAALEKTSHHRSVSDLEKKAEPEALAERASVIEVMKRRLKTEAGKAKYKLRQQTVEPVFGIIKSVLGFRRFLLRGLEKAALEWELVSLACNCKRLHRLGAGMPGAQAGGNRQQAGAEAKGGPKPSRKGCQELKASGKKERWRQRRVDYRIHYSFQ